MFLDYLFFWSFGLLSGYLMLYVQSKRREISSKDFTKKDLVLVISGFLILCLLRITVYLVKGQ
mgnify:CR=1